MVAQIHARAALPEESHAHGLVGFDAGSAQLGQHSHEFDATRAKGIGEDTAGDASCRRTLERRDHAARDRIVGDDVEEQVDVRTRGVDVGDESVEDPGVVGQHFDGIAPENRHFAQLFREPDAWRERRVLRGAEHVGVTEEPGANGARELAKGGRPPQPPRRQPPATEHEVECKPQDRLEQDQQQPPFRGVGRAAKRDDDEHRDADDPLDRDEKNEERMALGREVKRHRGCRCYGRDGVNRIEPESTLRVSTRSPPRIRCPDTAPSPLRKSASRVSDGQAIFVRAIGPMPRVFPLRT